MSISTSVAEGRSKVKVVMLGDQGVGKTSIIEKFVHNKFDEISYVPAVLCSPLSASISWQKTTCIKTKG